MKKFDRRMTLFEKAQMRSLYEQNYSLGYIARKFKCCTNTVWNTVYDLSVMKMSSLEKKSAIKTSKITPKQVKIIRLKARQGATSPQLGKEFNLSQSSILSIIKGRTFRWLPGWIRLNKSSKFFFYKPIFVEKSSPNSDRKPGPKLGSKKIAKYGEVLRLAKKLNVSPSTICRWRKKGRKL